MVEGLIVVWGIGLIGTLIGLMGSVYLIISLKTLIDREIKKYFFLIFISSILIISYSTMVIYFRIIKLEITNNLWVLFPLLFFAAAVSWIIATSKLMNLVKAIQEKTSKQLDISKLQKASDIDKD